MLGFVAGQLAKALGTSASARHWADPDASDDDPWYVVPVSDTTQARFYEEALVVQHADEERLRVAHNQGGFEAILAKELDLSPDWLTGGLPFAVNLARMFHSHFPDAELRMDWPEPSDDYAIGLATIWWKSEPRYFYLHFHEENLEMLLGYHRAFAEIVAGLKAPLAEALVRLTEIDVAGERGQHRPVCGPTEFGPDGAEITWRERNPDLARLHDIVDALREQLHGAVDEYERRKVTFEYGDPAFLDRLKKQLGPDWPSTLDAEARP